MNQQLERRHGLVLAASIIIVGDTLAQPPSSADPVYGTWVLDRAQSVFLNRPAPLGQTRIYEVHPEGLKATVVTVNADGTETRTEYVAEYDGIEYPFRGSEQADAIIMQWHGPRTALATFRHAGSEVGNARREISRDGATMTVTVTLRSNVQSIAVFKRAEPPAANPVPAAAP